MAHHWSEGVGVLRFTPREYEQELVEAGGAGGLLACPPQPAVRFVALKVLQELAWQIRSPNIRKTVLLVPPRRLKTVALEISLLTDLKAVVVGDFVDEQMWRDCVENNQVLVVTSSILDDLLQRGVLTMVKINLLVIEDCHSIASDPHLQRIITSYKSYKQRVHGTDDVIPKVVAFTHPLFSQEFLLDDESKNSDKQSNTIDTDSEYASSENEEIEDDNENKPMDALEHFTETVISEQEQNEDWQKMTDFNYWRRDFEDIDLKLPAIESTSAERAAKDDENECSSEALSQANTVSDVAVNSRSERCFATDSEREPSVRRSVYDKLECQLEKLESMIFCKADMASDVAGLKKITGKPREVILECPQTSPGSEEGKKLEDFMKKVVSGAMVFLKDHRYDPTEIYGDEAFGEELRAIPNPCVEPVVMLQQFLYVLDQSGPYGADKAAFSLLVRIEKLKVKIPYERHFLLLCLVTSVFLQIRAAAELVFQKYPNELERIQRFTRPRFLRMMEIFKIFKPESSDKTVDSSPMNFPLRGSNLQNDSKQQCDNGSLTTEERIDSFVLNNEENVLNVSDICEKYIPELNNKVEIVLDNDSIQILIESGDPDVLLNETDGSLVCDSLPENDASQDSVIRDSLLAVDAGSQCGESGVTEVLQELERCDFKRLGRKIEEKSEEIKFTSFGVKRHSCDSGDTEARKKMKCSDCETTASDATERAQKFAEETKEDRCSLETEEVVIETKENIVNVHPSISKITLESGAEDSLNLADGVVCLTEKPTTQTIDNLGGVKVELSDSEESTLNTENVILKAMCSSGMIKNKEDVGSRYSSKDSSSHEKLDGVFEVCGSKAISAGVIDPGRMSEAEFEDRQICYNRPSEVRGASGFSPRKRVWEGGKKGKGKGVRGNYHRNYGWNDPDALCGLVFVDEPLMAKILCALINEYCRSCPELLFVFPQYTVDKMVDPLTDPREAEIEHKRQEEVLKRFRTHECNLLIGTAVLEDGMDLPKCNLVVRWDPPRGYRSYAACRARARAPKSLYALMAPKNPGKLVTALAQYAQIEKMLIRKCSWNEPGPTEEAHAGRFTPLVEAYRPSAQAVSLAQAVQLLNRYCAKLPSDSFTRLVPLWTTEPLVYRDKVLFVCSIRLPINCPLKCQIVGHPMPTRVLARRIAALQVCRALHMSGELDDNLLPIGKENFRALDPDWLSLPPTSDLQSILDGSVEARPGTTKRKQYYYKKVARSLSDCRPALGRPCLAYEVRALLAVPLPERHNTRGRKLHPPQAYKEGFAILTDRPIHQIPTFPMFTRSGEVQVNLERMKVRVVLNAHRERMVHRFMRYTFTEVLRVHNHLMVFDSKGRQKRNSYYVVPTTKVFSPDGSTSVAIDWKFLELIYSQTENVAKETILKTLNEKIEHVQDLDDSKASYECDADEYVAICSKNESDQLEARESTKDYEKLIECDLADSRKDIPSESTSKDDNVVVVGDVNSSVDIKEEENQPEHDVDQKYEKCIELNEDTDDLNKAPKSITVDANETDRPQIIVAEGDDASEKGEVDDGEIAIEASGDISDLERAVVEAEPVVEELEEMPNPYLAQGEVFVFDNEKYRDAVVMPWYRNQDQPQYFYVAEICWHLSPLSAFPSSQHSTFEDYYRSKYGVRITQPHQPLLDVDHTSARLNLLTPRFVNRKGVALPTSSERTKKAKRESLDQKQILVPELCHTHPFRGALWRAAVALPCVLYRINSLLLADEIRRSVALVVALGRPRLKPDFRWPPLDFGWSLADVLREEGAVKRDGALSEAPKPEGELKQLTERGATSEDGTDEGREKTANDIIAEKEEADKGESGDVFEVGMWSNEMAASVPAPADCDEERDDETVAASKLPGNITMCPSQGGADWSLATSPRRQNHQRKYSVADSDASYVSSEFDVSGDEAATSDEETDDEDDDKTTETSEPVTEKGGIRIEFKSGNEAEAIEVAPATLKPLVEDPADVEQQMAEERNSMEEFSRFFYGRDDEDDEVTRASVEKFQRAIEFNEVDILKNGVLIPCGQSVESIKMQDFSETIPFHNHQNNVQMFGARGVIKHWKAAISTESDDSITDSNIKPGSVDKSTRLNRERNKCDLDSFITEISVEKVVQHFQYDSQLDSSDVKQNESDHSVDESTEFGTTKYTNDLVVDLRDVDDDRTNPFREVFEMALSKSEIAELFREMFPYEDGQLDGVDSEDGLLKNGRVTLEDLETNKRRILNEIKESMSKEEWRKYNFFALKDFDDEHFENEYADVSQRRSFNDSENGNLVAETGERLTDSERMSSAKGSAVVKNTKSVDKNSDFNINFSFDYQPDLNSHPGPSPSVILQALTMSNANDGINLERLETIGDSFLKYAITTYLYCTYQNIHEGKLSHLRSKQVSNLNLYRLGRSRALGGRMVASKFEPHDNWLPPCHRVPPHLERALIDTHIPSTLWNVAEMPSLENMSREQIEKLVKEKVAQHHSRPPRGTAPDDNEKDNNSGVIGQIVNTDCPVHGALRGFEPQIASADGVEETIPYFEELTETINKTDNIVAKTVDLEENSLILKSETKIVEIQSTEDGESSPKEEKPSDGESSPKEEKPSDGESSPKEKKPSDGESSPKEEKPSDGESSPKEEKPSDGESSPKEKKPSDGESSLKEEKPSDGESSPKEEKPSDVAQSVSESSDEDSDDDDVSKPNTARGASLKERYRGYLESGLGKRCTCSLVQTPVGVAERTQKIGAGEVPEDVPCFVPYNLITQHSIPDKSVADCVEALIGAYLIECGPRGALLFMAWLGIRVLPKEEVVMNPDHPFVKIMKEASLKSDGKTVSEGTVGDTERGIKENNDSIVKITDENTTDDKREICVDGKVTELGTNVKIKDLEPIDKESVESKGEVCTFNPRKKSKRPRKRRNKNRKHKEKSDRTADESWESIEESLPSPEVKCFEDDTKPIKESPIRECELVKKSDTVETMCSKMAKMEKYNVLPKFVDEMDFWCGDEPIDEDSCEEDDVDYPPHCDEEPDEEASEKDPYDSEDDESDLEDDWNWDGRIPGSLKPQKDDQGRWVQVVFGELKPPPSPLLRNVPDPEGELMQMLSGYDSLERTLGYRFRDRCYLLQAMTHASHSSNRLTDCYQRLEFLGDAVLDYLITRQLYEDPRRHSPGALTDLRSALVNNTIFASLAVRHGMHKYFRHLSPGLDEVLARFVKIQEENGHSISEEHYLIQEDECEQAEDVEVPKALGDLFESVAGAIFLDSGMSLDAVWRVYHSLMQREMEMFSETVPKSPVRELLEMEPETAKFGKPEKLADGRRVRVTVEVLGAGAFKGVGRNYRIAKCTAAKCALRHLNSPRAKTAGARK